jgi:hypothetical protein
VPHFLKVVRRFLVNSVQVIFYFQEFLRLPVVFGSEENWAVEGSILKIVIRLLNLIDKVFFLKITYLILFFQTLLERPEYYRIDVSITPPAFFVTMGQHVPLATTWHFCFVS